MTDHGVYFWQRLPLPARRPLLVSAGFLVLLGLIVGGLTAIAQSEAVEVGGDIPLYSLPMHVLAMCAVASLAVAVAVGLRRVGLTALAVVVLAAVVYGPMTLVAVPVDASVVDLEAFDDTLLGWRMLVALVLFVVLAGCSLAVERCLDARPTPADKLWPTVIFVAALVIGIAMAVQLPEQANLPADRALLGWAVLAAGIVVVVAFGSSAWLSLAATVGAAAVLLLVAAAYSRDGGWPGVAGWEYEGMQSPIITSVASTITLLAAGALGLGVRMIFNVAKRHAEQLVAPEPAAA